MDRADDIMDFCVGSNFLQFLPYHFLLSCRWDKRCQQPGVGRDADFLPRFHLFQVLQKISPKFADVDDVHFDQNLCKYGIKLSITTRYVECFPRKPGLIKIHPESCIHWLLKSAKFCIPRTKFFHVAILKE